MNIFTLLLTQPLANGLVIFYRLLGSNMGLAIIVFSIALRFLLSPLTKPYLESMKKMREIAPQIEKLKKRHKGDKIKFTQAQADLYKEKGINPGAGCLPYLLQIVVLIAFFRMFSLTLTGDSAISAFNELLYPALKFPADAVLNTKFLYLDISHPDTLTIPGISFALPGPILFLAAITQLVSAKIMQPYEETTEKIAKKTSETTDDFQVAMQKSMIITFPLMTLFIGLQFPAGLALYWVTFSMFQAIQQYQSQGWGGMTPWLNRLGLVKSNK